MFWVVCDGRNLVWSGDGREYLRGVGVKYLLHPAFVEGFEKILTLYRPARKYRLCLVLPCSYAKPYSHSFIHYHIIKALRESGHYNEIHQVIVTNAGVVPRELEEYYPYIAYDWNPRYETPQIKERYVEVLSYRLRKYIEKFREFYEKFACFLRHDSDSYRAVREVEKALGIEIPNLAPEEVPREEVEEVSLHGVYYDPDLALITPTALKSLVDGVKKLLES